MSKPYRQGRLPRAFARPIRRSTDLARLIFRAGDPVNEFEAVKHYWNSPAMRLIRAFLDAIPTLKFGDYEYRRSSLFGIVLVAHLFGLPLSKAHVRVQTSAGLRRLLGFEPMTKAAGRQQRKLGGSKPLASDRFPVRQTVSYFVNGWLERSAADLIELLRAEAEKVALTAILDHDLDASRLACDGARVLSPTVSKRVKRHDEGAEFQKRDGEKALLSRTLMTILLTDVPFVLAARFTVLRHEASFTGEEMIPEFARLDQQLIELARDRGLKHEGFRNAALSGDSIFNNTPFIKALYANGLLPAFDQPGWPHVELVGQRVLRREDGGQVVCDLANNGAHYCECDRWENSATRKSEEPLIPRPISDRRPMRQLRGRPGVHVMVVCENSTCIRRGKEFYVALGYGPDVLRNGQLVRGEEDYTIITSLPRMSKRHAGITFKGRQAVENRHTLLHRHALLGKKRGIHRRVIHRDFPHHFWYALADLVHNQTLAFNLATDRSERENIPWDELYLNKLGNHSQVERRKALRDGKHDALERENAPPDELPLAA